MSVREVRGACWPLTGVVTITGAATSGSNTAALAAASALAFPSETGSHWCEPNICKRSGGRKEDGLQEVSNQHVIQNRFSI